MERSDGRAASDNWRVWANCADSNCLIRTVNLWLREHGDPSAFFVPAEKLPGKFSAAARFHDS